MNTHSHILFTRGLTYFEGNTLLVNIEMVIPKDMHNVPKQHEPLILL